MTTLLLSKAMRQCLRNAPEEWRKVSPSPTVVALEARGLVKLRDDPADKSPLMRGYQWKITEAGGVMDGRLCACCQKPRAH